MSDPVTEATTPTKAPKSTKNSVINRLYRGETSYQFVGKRKIWYGISGTLIVICVLSMIFRGFNEGVEFAGGTQFQIAGKGTSLTTKQVEKAFEATTAKIGAPAESVGTGSDRSYVIKLATLTPDESAKVQAAVAKSLNISADAFSVKTIGASWGSDISKKALQGLIVFLVVVSIYIAIRFQPRMAAAAIVALLHDLVLTAGIYSLIGFEVTPSTVVGLLTILGFSLYDTVVIFDKVAENTKDLTAGSRETFSSATNRAVNQTLMRSINTSLISLLPVAGLLFIGAGVLGVGTIKDLALVMFVGLATGAYSSLFLAAPIVTDLTERLPAYKALSKRVAAKRASEAARGLGGDLVTTGPRGRNRTGGPAPAPRPGARPQRVAAPTTEVTVTKPVGKATRQRPAAKPAANRSKQVPRRKK
jgi:preprotein translocase subunit SecF